MILPSIVEHALYSKRVKSEWILAAMYSVESKFVTTFAVYLNESDFLRHSLGIKLISLVQTIGNACKSAIAVRGCRSRVI